MSAPPPFALLTHDLILLPTPWAIEVKPYRTLFRALHADQAFCQVAFGPHFPPVYWTDDEVRTKILSRDATLRWAVRGMGDFALGVLPTDFDGHTAFHTAPGPLLRSPGEDVRIITGDAFQTLQASGILEGAVRWAGYSCARDATTAGGAVTDLYAERGDSLPPWQDMVEVRYGMDPGFRGRGIATRAAHVVMRWAAEEHGARRFIAETEPGNIGSQRLLERLGFEKSGTTYFGNDGAVEWAKTVE